MYFKGRDIGVTGISPLNQRSLEKLSKPRKRRLKLGDIYEIPLPNGTNAYGRLYKECTLAIYKTRCDDVTELPETGALNQKKMHGLHLSV